MFATTAHNTIEISVMFSIEGTRKTKLLDTALPVRTQFLKLARLRGAVYTPSNYIDGKMFGSEFY